MTNFIRQPQHITDYTTQPLPIVRNTPHPWLIELPQEDTHPLGVISRFETVHSHSITPRAEQDEVEWEERLSRFLGIILIILLLFFIGFICSLLLGGGLPA